MLLKIIHGVAPKRLLLVKMTRSMFLFENYTATDWKKKAEVVSTFLRTLNEMSFLFEHFSLVEELTTLTEQNTHFDTKLSVYFLQNNELTLNLANKCRWFGHMFNQTSLLNLIAPYLKTIKKNEATDYLL